MYSNYGLLFGFHGAPKKLLIKFYNTTRSSKNPNVYDWLGHGIYFWEGDPQRAYEFARDVKKIEEPAVVGAVIDLGICLNLMYREHLEQLKKVYDLMDSTTKELTQNKTLKGSKDLLLRNLDCAVIELAHDLFKEQNFSFDSVRGLFFEGNEIYPKAGFKEKNHIQICIKNPDKCIKTYFKPRITNKFQ